MAMNYPGLLSPMPMAPQGMNAFMPFAGQGQPPMPLMQQPMPGYAPPVPPPMMGGIDPTMAAAQPPQSGSRIPSRFGDFLGNMLTGIGAGLAANNPAAGSQAIALRQGQMTKHRERQEELAKQGQARNATVEYLRKKGRDDLIGMVQNGAISANEALAEANRKPDDRKIMQDQGGVPRYVDTGEPVFAATGPQEADFKTERDLRQEYNKTDVMDAYGKIRDSFERVRAAAQTDSGPGDLGLIFNYMKMLDPGSVVREGEFATAQNSGGISETVRNMYNRVVSGERLSPELRQQFVSASENLYGETAANLEDTNKRYGGIAQQWRVDPSRVLVQPERYEPLRLGEKKTIAPGVTIRKVK